jgi:hypothetical protein
MTARQKLAAILGLPLDEIEWRDTEGIYTTERLNFGRLPAWTRANANYCWAVGEPRRLNEALNIGFDCDVLAIETAFRWIEMQRSAMTLAESKSKCEALHGSELGILPKTTCSTSRRL